MTVSSLLAVVLAGKGTEGADTKPQSVQVEAIEPDKEAANARLIERDAYITSQVHNFS